MAEVNWHNDAEDLVLRYIRDPKPDLKDLLMVRYGSLVERTARKFNGIEPLEDLIQVGFIGLLNALSKFDPEAGVRFNTYATYLIAGEIKHYLRDRTQTIRHPAWLQELRHKVNRATSVLQQSLGRMPTELEIAENLGVSACAVNEVQQTQEMLRVASLDQPTAPDDEGSEGDMYEATSICQEQIGVEDRLVLEYAVKQLRDLEQRVVRMFHFDGMNQTEIANELGLSCNYVSHILRQSMSKLRTILAREERQDQILRRQADDMDYEVVDSLTSAYTEAYLRARLQEEIHRAQADQTSVAVLVVKFEGLDGTMRFYGAASIESFLVDAAEFFRANVRRVDVVARFGETGFGILLPSTGSAVAKVHDRLVNRVRAWLHGRTVEGSGLRVLLGQATAPRDGRSANELLDNLECTPAGSEKRAA